METPSCVSTCSTVPSRVHSYLLANSETEDEPEQYEYEWSPKIEKERAANVDNALKRQKIEPLLKNATLTEREPYVYSDLKNDPDNNLPYCTAYCDTLKQFNKMYPVQEMVWPYIRSGRSSILVGKTEFYPHLLYMPPILNLVKVSFDWIN